MKAKTKLSMGVRRKRKPSIKGLQKQKKVSLRHVVGAAKASMSPEADAVRSALGLRVKLTQMQVAGAESDHRVPSLYQAKSSVSCPFSPLVRQTSRRP